VLGAIFHAAPVPDGLVDDAHSVVDHGELAARKPPAALELSESADRPLERHATTLADPARVTVRLVGYRDDRAALRERVIELEAEVARLEGFVGGSVKVEVVELGRRVEEALSKLDEDRRLLLAVAESVGRMRVAVGLDRPRASSEQSGVPAVEPFNPRDLPVCPACKAPPAKWCYVRREGALVRHLACSACAHRYLPAAPA